MNKKLLVPAAYALGAIFVAVALVYFLTPANHLPNFMPGYDLKMTTPHIKHGLACLVLAAACGVFGWFASGPKASVQEKEGS